MKSKLIDSFNKVFYRAYFLMLSFQSVWLRKSVVAERIRQRREHDDGETCVWFQRLGVDSAWHQLPMRMASLV